MSYFNVQSLLVHLLFINNEKDKNKIKCILKEHIVNWLAINSSLWLRRVHNGFVQCRQKSRLLSAFSPLHLEISGKVTVFSSVCIYFCVCLLSVLALAFTSTGKWRYEWLVCIYYLHLMTSRSSFVEGETTQSCKQTNRLTVRHNWRQITCSISFFCVHFIFVQKMQTVCSNWAMKTGSKKCVFYDFASPPNVALQFVL